MTTHLYELTSVMNDWPHRNGRYNDVQVTWFVYSRQYETGFDYTAMLYAPESADPNRIDQGCVDELFTRSEADQFAKYMKEQHNVEVAISQVQLPMNGVCMPIGGTPVGGDCDFYMLYMHDDYNLPFRVMGYYRIDCYQCQRATPPCEYCNAPAATSGVTSPCEYCSGDHRDDPF